MNIKVFAFALCAIIASVQETVNGQNGGSGAIGFPGSSGGASRNPERRRKKTSCSCSGLDSAHLESLSQVSLGVDLLMEPIIQIYNSAAGNRRESYSINESMCRSFTVFKWAIIISLNAIVRSQPTGVISIATFLYTALVHLSEFQNAVIITLEQSLLRRPVSNLVAIVEFLQHRAQEGASGVINVFFDAMKTVANGKSALLTCIESGRTQSEKGVKQMVDLIFRALRILLAYVHKIEFTPGEGYTPPSFPDIKTAMKIAFRLERSSFFGPIADVCRTNCEE